MPLESYIPLEQLLKVPPETWKTHIALQRIADIVYSDAEVFWKIACKGYNTKGRGALAIWFNNLKTETNSSLWITAIHLITHLQYYSVTELEEMKCKGTLKHVKTYDPHQFFVLLLGGGIEGRAVVPTQVNVINKNYSDTEVEAEAKAEVEVEAEEKAKAEAEAKAETKAEVEPEAEVQAEEICFHE